MGTDNENSGSTPAQPAGQTVVAAEDDKASQTKEVAKELEGIVYEEGRHFTGRRLLFILINLTLLLINGVCDKNLEEEWLKITISFGVALAWFGLTYM